MARIAFGAAAAASVVLICGPARAVTCQGVPQPTTLDICQRGWQCVGDGWLEVYYAAGTACNDNDACTSSDVCNGGNFCSGTLTSPPGVPGPMNGPASTNFTGAYTIGWGASTTCYPSRYELSENGVLVYSGAALSFNVSGKHDNTYTYQVRACNSAACSAYNTPIDVSVLLPPGTPGVPQAHRDSTCAPPVLADTAPDYTICWTPGTGNIARYEFGESTDNSTWTTSTLPKPTPTSPPPTSQQYSNKSFGNYYYRVRSCNDAGCSAYTASNASSVVEVITGLASVADSPVPATTPADSEWVGVVPGTPSVEGGAATYRIPIEVPPGRAGMQPEVALTYGSRGGNGIAGVGWTLSGSSTIYRCPRTLAQDGGGRAVRHDNSDGLCMDGQRLVTNGTMWGVNSEYRTEVDEFARVTLTIPGTTMWSAVFVVERKNGRIGYYRALGIGQQPDTWGLVTEFDRHGNCAVYSRYDNFLATGNDESLLSDIAYTGASSGTAPLSLQCTMPADARHVSFGYEMRPDVRTTYQYGNASPMTLRLASIVTSVGSQPVRRYQLTYSQSAVTQRSLLTQVTLCAGSPCTASLPPTTFSYQQELPSFTTDTVSLQGQQLGKDWHVMVGADLDGDGTRDRIYTNDTTAGTLRTLELSSCRQNPGTYDPNTWFGETLRDGTPMEGHGDLNYDGRTDIVGTGSGTVEFADLKCAASGPPLWISETADLTWSPSWNPDGTYPTPSLVDFDGDGRMDLNYLHPSQGPTVVLHNSNARSAWAGANSATIHPPSPPANTASTLQDLNGDGLVDVMYDALDANATPATWVSFFLGRSAGFSPLYTLDQLGGPTGSLSGTQGRMLIDVNGDGLADIYQPGQLWLNRGHTPDATTPTMFKGPIAVATPAFARNRIQYAFTMDIDNDGKQELMVPDHRSMVSTWCGGDPTQVYGPDSAPAWFCGDEFDAAPKQYWSYDRSIFVWTAYRFVEAADGTFSLVAVPTATPLEAPINYGLQMGDDDGNGTDDVFFREINGLNRNGYDASVSLGPRISHNHAGAPDLLTEVDTGVAVAAGQPARFGSKITWQHQPLSLPDVPGCDKTEGKPFYTVNLDGARSPGYMFFTSSMWVVSRFDVDNGIGGGSNRTCYRYEDAMLNGQGRGFQGFKTIVAEEQLPPAAGEPPALFGYSCGGGGHCSANNLRTTTRFYQEFPLTSRLQEVTVSTLDGHVLSDSQYLWDAQYSPFTASSPRVVEVSAIGHVDKKSEPGGQLSSVTAVISELDAASGEATKVCTISSGAAAQPSSDVIVRDTRTLNSDTTNWLLGQVLSRTVVNDFFGGTLPSASCQVSAPAALVPSACASIPPTCPSSAAKAPKTRMTYYTLFAGSGLLQSETLIKPGTVPPAPPTVVPDADVESRASYTYDAYGNVLTKQVSARDAGADATYPPASNGLVAVGTTLYTLSADSYFATLEKNPRGHQATTTTDPATGNVTYHQPIQGGPATTMEYDGLGRLKTSTTDGMQPVRPRIFSCAAGDCVLKRQVFQAGAPVKTEYVDRLGRVIATGAEGFDGFEVVTKVDYNARGAKIAEHQPISTGLAAGSWNGTQASPYMTQYSGIDALGRVATKTVVRTSAANFFEPGKGSANLVTTYSYSVVPAGIKTSITVLTPTAASGQITMSRTYDPRGKLVQTVQDVTSPTAHSITTAYAYDPAGNLLTIADSQNNQLKAVYDDLGRKIEVDDPDRGIWLYTWDGLSRVRTQKDARNITLAYQYDAIGRMERRFMLPAGQATWLLEANWQYDLNNKAGTLGAMYGVPDNTAGAALDLTQPVAMFHRDYKYDALLRPWSITTHVPAEGNAWAAQDFTIEYGYDYNYGRMKAMSSPKPNQEFVRFDYDSRGTAIGETPLGSDGNPPAGASAYRQVRSMSIRGQVAEQVFGNGVDETMDYDDSTGLATWMSATGLHEPSAACPSAPTSLVRQLTYKYDHFLNLARQERDAYARDSSGALVFSACSPIDVTAKETYDYDELQRLTLTSRSWTNLTPDAAAAAPTQYVYSDLGNIVSKSDYAQAYTYPPSGGTTYAAPGPHAVTSLSNGMTFSYDANGNLTTSNSNGLVDRTETFDNLDRPIKITKGTVTTIFRYAPDGSRYLQRTSTSDTTRYPKTVYYVDKLFERVVWSGTNPATEERTYVGPATVIDRSGTARDVRYMDLDRLGSTEAVTTSSAAEYVADQHSFDAFGKPRKGDFTTGTARLHSTDYNVTTEHGFTGHEHLDETYLIHMNGRVYDYQLGRFLSVDPIISNPANSQSINPYSYIGNNPLSGVDPTGYADQPPPTDPCGAVTGSHLCGHAGAGDNVTINGIPVIGGKLNPGNAKSGAGGGASSSGGSSSSTPHDKEGAPGTNDRKTQAAPGSTWGRDASGHEYTSTWTRYVPVYGSGTEAVHDFRSGNWGFGLFHSAMALSDLWLAKGAAVALGKLAAKGLAVAAATIVMKRGEQALVRAAAEEAGEAALTSALAKASNAAEHSFLTEEGLEHILERHAFESQAPNAGKFAEGVDIKALIHEALTSDSSLIRPGSGGRIIIEHAFETTIGMTREGTSTSLLRTVLDPTGRIVTSFPK